MLRHALPGHALLGALVPPSPLPWRYPLVSKVFHLLAPNRAWFPISIGGHAAARARLKEASMIHSQRRSAFTLIELLVVIAILGILVGLLLPAVQKVRESANRMKCQNNLKQIGLALHNYHDGNLVFPTGWTFATSWGALSHLLPYIEQDNLFKQIDFTRGIYDPVNLPVTMMPVNMFLCPSDFANPMPSLGGATNYCGNAGNHPVFVIARGLNANDPPPNGMFYTESKNLNFASMYDGSSNTALYSERVLGDGNMGIVSPLEDVFNGPNASPGRPATPDEAYAWCQSVDITNPANQFPIFMGAPWAHGQHNYQHISPPNARSCGWLPSLRATMAASSRHSSGVNVAFGDGSIRFISNSVDLSAWRAMGSRNGGEVITNY
jgi:prepilin-type N-terminal cleavage/methylation domain-containing protein/prepilin-type processing-associated H-X9-DG protein